MGKKLAIKGHATRGKEVIELLEMMGGKNTYEYNGRYLIDEIVYTREVAYYIDFESQIRCIDIKDITTNFIVYSLEMFLKTFPFKVDDKVIDEADGCPGVVCKMKWDEDVSDMKYCVAFGNGVDFGWFVNDSINFLKIKKNENLEENKFPSFEPMFKMNDELEYKIPDGYEITEVSKGKVFIKPIKSKYPTTYEECCEIIHSDPNFYIDTHLYSGTLESLYKLLICRTAYWKIAGEQMGLDKPWEPDLENEELYCIQNYNKQIVIGRTNTAFNKILIFPTEEMRDAFYDNFKDLIEQCKELL